MPVISWGHGPEGANKDQKMDCFVIGVSDHWIQNKTDSTKLIKTWYQFYWKDGIIPRL